MSDSTPNGPPASNGEAAPQGTGDQRRFNVLPISVIAQYIKDLSFENPRAPQSLVGQNQPPQVAIQVDVRASGSNQPGVYEVTLHLKAEATADNAIVFIAELSYAGLFSLPGVPQEHHQMVAMIECPRLLFPFARAIMAEITRDGGYPPLLLTPVDFADLYRRQVAAQQQQQGGPPAAEGSS